MIFLLATIASASQGRFNPSHEIVESVYCGSCHPEEVEELNATTHLAYFSRELKEKALASGREITEAQAISGACMMCHGYWENMKFFGVTNFSIVENKTVKPDASSDVYGNIVSPYGLASTGLWVMGIWKQPAGAEETEGVEPWQGGIGSYDYIDMNGIRHSRLDYVWSALSALSPGPATFEIRNGTGEVGSSCGNAEKGLCHAAFQAVGMALVNDNNTFFVHEIPYTTAQYAAEPVKLCGACHVFELPPMTWGGEPWSQGVIEAASLNGGAAPIAANAINNNPDDPFGFKPNYDMTGFVKLTNKDDSGSTQYSDITYKTPDWAHQNVPCIGCHAHAGISGVTVSDNTVTETNP